MSKKMSKNLMLVAGAIGLLGIIFLARIMAAGGDSITASEDVQNSVVSPFISFSIIILVLTTVITILFSGYNLFLQPENLKKALIGIGVLGVLFIITYFLSSDSQVTDITGIVLMEQSTTSKWVSAGINYSFLLGTIGLILFLWDFVKSMIK